MASDDDRKKGPRQATMAEDRTSDKLSLIIPAVLAPVGANGGVTTATPPASTTPAAANGDLNPHPHAPGPLAL
jgi:hypothetical protein